MMQVNPLRSLYLHVILLGGLGVTLIAPRYVQAQRWNVNVSESEVTSIVRELLSRAELPPDKVLRGSYPLLNYQGNSSATLPLLSFPCPLLLSCDALTTQLKSQLLTRGYQLVYSDQSPRENGPIYYAVARGKTPVMVLRLYPSHTTITSLLHITQTLIQYQSVLHSLPLHLTLSFDEELLGIAPRLIQQLIEQGREHFIRVDEVMVKRAMLDPNTGSLILDSAQRRTQFAQRIDVMFERLPSALGVYLDQRAQDALDRSLTDELVARCAIQHRMIVAARHHDDILRSVTRSHGVRFVELKHYIDDNAADQKQLNDQLRALEATLVLTGDVTLDLHLSSASQLREFNEWISRVTQRQVNILRISEIAR